MKLEWPTQLGGTVGNFVGQSIGDWIAWFKTPQTLDLTPWKIDVCGNELKALTGDIKVLSTEIESFKQSIKTDDPQKANKEKDLRVLNTIKETYSNRVELITTIQKKLNGVIE